MKFDYHSRKLIGGKGMQTLVVYGKKWDVSFCRVGYKFYVNWNF